MIFLTKIAGFVLIIFGTVSVLFVIPAYRALKSDETKFYLVLTKTSNLPNDAEESEFVDAMTPISQAKFIRIFILPSIFILIAGLVTVIIAYRYGIPRRLSEASKQG